MIAADVMTRNVISVPPDATVADAVELMLGRGISGLLVVDTSGMLAGIVTEGDLLRRDELGTQRRRSWWLRLLASPGRQAADFTRAHGRKVADVMTHDVLSVAADAPLTDIVALMEEHRVKRVPVLDGLRVVAWSAAPICCARCRSPRVSGTKRSPMTARYASTSWIRWRTRPGRRGPR
jgi:CBS domain-containing protein